jgi:glycogen debranching enzyme
MAPSRHPAHDRRMSRIVALVSVIALASCATTPTPPAAPPTLRFQIDEGRNINSFVREGAVAAHLLLRSGTDPRILVAFPAGNSGVGLWFNKSDQPVTWTLSQPPVPVSEKDAGGRPLHGIEAEVTVDTAKLDFHQAVLSSVRVLRDYQALGTLPDGIAIAPTVTGNRIVWARDRLDGAAGYRLSIETLDGTQVSKEAITGSGTLRLKIVALTGETPLTPIDNTSLLTATAARDTRARDVLTFLSYREKYLAGSWRFDTYFGRDTLMSLTLLAPVLQNLAIESGIGAVLTRLAPNGEVAHEEDIGEFAVLRNIKEGRGAIDTPIYDYGMIDDDFMLAPVTANWLLESEGRAVATKFLSDKNATGQRQGDSLVRNLVWVVERTAAFAVDPTAANLVGLKEGRMTGQWRDSEEGLGRGRYAYDVNAVFVPAALDAIDRLLKSGLIDGYLTDAQRRTLQKASAQHDVWSHRAPPMFTVTLPANQARDQVAAYATALGVDAKTSLAALDSGLREQSLTFNALALDASGKPIPIMHSDDGFALLFTQPTPAQLQRSIDALMRPFPAGLLTPVGMLVANPAFADRETQSRFDNTAYHGTVVWSWQQAVFAAGLSRQLARADLSADLRTRLQTARAQLWKAIDAGNALRSSELWSWSFSNGVYRPEAFGQHNTHADESNAAQLWSTVYLSFQNGEWLGARQTQ